MVGSTNVVGRRLAAEIQEYIRASNAGIQMETVFAADCAMIHKDLQARGATTFYLVEDKYWSAGFGQLRDSVMRDPSFQFERSWSFKGIEIWRFRVVRSQTVPVIRQKPEP
ncbi:MAG: hypothetical protein EHM61_23135 [Acidobacteria bacterium]|nr:MAG: hypothetical protein EHM61_23135 [Acidobacteriota bacterium]